jgi:hypothetical protein
MPVETRAGALSVDDMIERFPNEWIFMQVTAKDVNHTPSHGIVLAHHPKRAVLQRRIAKEIATRTTEGIEYCVFQAFPRNLSLGDVLRDVDERSLDEVDRIEQLMLREAAR